MSKFDQVFNYTKDFIEFINKHDRLIQDYDKESLYSQFRFSITNSKEVKIKIVAQNEFVHDVRDGTVALFRDVYQVDEDGLMCYFSVYYEETHFDKDSYFELKEAKQVQKILKTVEVFEEREETE